MPTRNISLTDEQDAFVAEIVETGEYQNASEAIRDALRTLQDYRQEKSVRLDALRSQLRMGTASLDAGEGIIVDDRDLEAYIASLSPSSRKTRRKRAR
jgi:antitoxin ParD1/3/4